jgi:hypothetical protein
VVDANRDVDEILRTEFFTKVQEPFGDNHFVQGSAPSVVNEILRALESLVMLNEIAFRAFLGVTFQNRAHRMPSGSKKNVAIRNEALARTGNVQNSDATIDGVPVDQGRGANFL